MHPPLPAQGRTAVRWSGDHYQQLLTWLACLEVLRDREFAGGHGAAVAVRAECRSAGSYDDFVLEIRDGPDRYHQAKYAVHGWEPVNGRYLVDASRSKGASLLAATVATYRYLTGSGEPFVLELVTNRAPDPQDPLIRDRDNRTLLLLREHEVPGRRTKKGAALAAWAASVGTTVPELVQVLASLRFRFARDVDAVVNDVRHAMVGSGLRQDDTAILSALGWIGQRVREGRNRFDLGAIEESVALLGLRRRPRDQRVLSLATLEPDAAGAGADHALDWVDRFDGTDSFQRRRPAPPATWQQLHDDILASNDALPKGGTVQITGTFRQATAFALGCALRRVTGRELLRNRGADTWSTTDPPDGTGGALIQETSHTIGQGPEVAVAVAMTLDPRNQVADYVRAAGLPVGRLVVLTPSGEPHEKAVRGGGHANALAVAVRDRVRHFADGVRPVHLFFIGPMEVALFLGHRWNACPPTTAYEFTQRPAYEPAFHIPR